MFVRKRTLRSVGIEKCQNRQGLRWHQVVVNHQHVDTLLAQLQEALVIAASAITGDHQLGATFENTFDPSTENHARLIAWVGTCVPNTPRTRP